MKNPLSAIVPVLNCQSTAPRLVGQLLEVLEELTPRFELLVIDNGSTDATRESLAELALCYPQLKLLTLATRRGAADVMRTGLRHSAGEIVLYRLEGCEAAMGCLAEMWHVARSSDVVTAARDRASLCDSPSPAPAWQMIRRRLLDAWARQRVESDWLQYLAARGYRPHEVEAHKGSGFRVQVSGRASGLPHAGEAKLRSAPRRPNYLDRIKAFAWGE